MNVKYKKIVVKIGTNVITRPEGLLDQDRLADIVSQIADLQKSGVEVVVVSSGAMGAGRGIVKLHDGINDIARRQVLAAVGQPELMHRYLNLFSAHSRVCAQVLATKEDFRDRDHYLNMRNCFEALLKEKIIPIVNENDVVSIDELMFTDNDELAGLIASMLNAEALVILSTVDGVKVKNAAGEMETKREVKSMRDVEDHLSPQTSSFGRGGMITKCRIAEKLSKLGIITHIVDGTINNRLNDVLEGKQVGTAFLCKTKKLSNVKRWIADSEGREQGAVIINERAEKVLRGDKAASLLPVGITEVTGDFKKGDIIKILNEKGESVGYGMAGYEAAKARTCIGKKDQKELIHYNTLFIHE